jgi:chromosome partitioning protein
MSASIICFANIKGGVGKTTLAINVAHALAKELVRRVLVVDMDPQINATTALLPFPVIQGFRETHGSVYQLFDNAGVGTGLDLKTLIPPEKVRPVPTGKGFDLLIGALDTAFLELRLPSSKPALDFDALKRGLQRCGVMEQYDHIIIDTPPTPSFYLVASLKAATHFVVPSRHDYLSIQGLGLFARVYRTLHDHRDLAITAQPLGVVLTMVQNGAQEREGLKRLEGLAHGNQDCPPAFFEPFAGTLPVSVAVARDQEKQRLIREGRPGNAASVALGKIVTELNRKLGR